MNIKTMLLLVVGLLTAGTVGAAQDNNGIDPEALIERTLAVDRAQREEIHDVTYDAEYIEYEDKGDEGYVEKLRIVKKVYVKYFEDTAWYHEEFVELYKDGKLQSEKDLAKEAKDRREKKAKRKARDISYPMLRPFYPERRHLYEITYLGVAGERIQDRVCHHFQVKAVDEVDTLINGDFYFEADGFHLVEVDFSPAKLVKKTMFKLKELNMTIVYGPNSEGYWLPRQFDISGKGKAAFFFGVNFSGTEYYTSPVVNSGLSDSLFEVDHGD
jgi:hypothetical protein